MKNKISIKQIAEIADVSVATVSRVLNGNGGYSALTEQRVRDVIETYQYVPNLVAKGLRKNRTQIIGIIVPDIANEYYGRLLIELQSELFNNGYLIMVCNINESAELEKEYVQAFVAQNVSGIILISSETDATQLQGIPTVYVDRRLRREEKNENVIFVESDNFQGGYLATKKMIERRCKKIVFITDMLEESSKVNRYEGYLKALEEAGIEKEDKLVIKVKQVTLDEAFVSVTQVLSSNPDIDGIVCATDILAIGATLAIQSVGKKVPEDIKVTGYDDISMTTLFKPSITTVHQHTDKMAELVTKLLLQLIQNEPVSKKHYVVPISFVERQSTQE